MLQSFANLQGPQHGSKKQKHTSNLKRTWKWQCMENHE
jgi:hypothetical protein